MQKLRDESNAGGAEVPGWSPAPAGGHEQERGLPIRGIASGAVIGDSLILGWFASLVRVVCNSYAYLVVGQVAGVNCLKCRRYVSLVWFVLVSKIVRGPSGFSWTCGHGGVGRLRGLSVANVNQRSRWPGLSMGEPGCSVRLAGILVGADHD